MTAAFKYWQVTLTEIILIKTLYIFKYSIIVSINEYFLTYAITTFNIVFAFGFVVIRIMLNDYEAIYSAHFDPHDFASEQSSILP